MSYSIDIIVKSVFERELSALLVTHQKEKEPIIVYIRDRINEIKTKHGIQ